MSTLTAPAPSRIPDRFTKPGFTYRLVERTANTAIYEQADRETGAVAAYEAMVIQRTRQDRTFPDGSFSCAGSEFLPSSEQWGRFAWTTQTIVLARERLTKNGHPTNQ